MSEYSVVTMLGDALHPLTSSAARRAKKTQKKDAERYTAKLSTDPQSVAARERRHKISDRFKILQSMIPGGSKMDTVSMLEEAINYVKFLQAQLMLQRSIMNMEAEDFSSSYPDASNSTDSSFRSKGCSCFSRDDESALFNTNSFHR